MTGQAVLVLDIIPHPFLFPTPGLNKEILHLHRHEVAPQFSLDYSALGFPNVWIVIFRRPV